MDFLQNIFLTVRKIITVILTKTLDLVIFLLAMILLACIFTLMPLVWLVKIISDKETFSKWKQKKKRIKDVFDSRTRRQEN